MIFPQSIRATENAQSVRASQRNSVIVGSNHTQANFV